MTDTIDRLQRDFKESVLLDELRKKEIIELHFYRENLVLNSESNSADILRWDMGVMFAKSYVLQIRDNVNRKMDAMFDGGEYPGRAPVGYLNVIKETGAISTRKERLNGTKWIVPDESKRAYIRRAFELYASGNYSYF